MDIELRLLRSLVAIYELGSLSRAAEHLGCTQAAMSMRLKMLEEEVGSPIFLRLHHRMEATPFGNELYAKALSVIASYDELISTTRSRSLVTKVRIGAPDDYAISILARVMRRMSLDISDIEFEIVCDLSANLFAAFHRQRLDLALITMASPPNGASFNGEARLSWVYHPTFRLNSNMPVPISVYPEGCVFRRAMISSLEATQIPWRVAAQSRCQAGILSAVRSGLAVTSMAYGTAPDDLIYADDSEYLPSLRNIPIYFMKSESARHTAITAIEKELRRELRPKTI